MNKVILRKYYRPIKEIALRHNNYHSALCRHLKSVSQLTKQSIIGSYIPLTHEIIPPHLPYHTYAYPWFISTSRTMKFVKHCKGLQYRKASFGIKTLIGFKSDMEVFPDVLLVPLICFDYRLHRIGYGGGYYDTYIAKYNVFTVGIGLECLKSQDLPVEKHDMRLNLVITQKGLYMPN